MTTTRSQRIAELDRKIDENRAESDARLMQFQTDSHAHIAPLQESLENRIDNRMEELHNLILTQAHGTLLKSVATSRPTPVSIPQPVLENMTQQVPVILGRSQPEANPTRHYSTRLSKVDFPKFDGKKVNDWLYNCDQFFLLVETQPESRVRLASIHLEGLALQWHLNYMRGRFDAYPLWDQNTADVRRRFW